MYAIAASGEPAGAVVLTLIAIAAAVAAYWTPTIVGLVRHAPNPHRYIILNALLGWTIVGWVVALVFACESDAKPPSAPFPVPMLPRSESISRREDHAK